LGRVNLRWADTDRQHGLMRDESSTLVRPAVQRVAGGTRFGVHLEVDGTVQGVGFRPFAYRLETELELDGFVRNTGGRVVIEAAGSRNTLDELIRRVTADAPPLARVAKVTQRELHPSPAATRGFRIETSDAASHASGLPGSSTLSSANNYREFAERLEPRSCGINHLWRRDR
jgi:acylphosphatase